MSIIAKALGLPWKWDRGGFKDAPAIMSVDRWRRGPVTFYRYTMDLARWNTHTVWWLYVPGDFGFAFHPPDWLLKLLGKPTDIDSADDT